MSFAGRLVPSSLGYRSVGHGEERLLPPHMRQGNKALNSGPDTYVEGREFLMESDLQG